ncbi:MAG: lipopolysaccharide heptosyltransferase II [Acidobacteriota bacterium]
MPNWVGDAVMALPALRELRRIFANSRITLAARPWVAGLFDGEGLADNLISVRASIGFFNSLRHFTSDARHLRREQFDYAVLFPNSFSSALGARAGGAMTIAGYPTDGRRLLLNHIVSFEPNYKTLHQVRYYLNIAAEIETKLTGTSRVDFEQSGPRLHAGEDLRQRARLLIERFAIASAADDQGPGFASQQPAHRAALTENEKNRGRQNPADNSPILAINPGATNSTAKRWPAERFAEAADRLADSDGFQTVIVGAEGDREVAEQVAALMRTPAVVLAGKTSIAELKAVLSCARVVISNDTGAAHVSAALGVPTVVVFGPTEHVSTRPLSEHAAVVRHDVECSPCMLRECPIDHRCMTGVHVEDVYRAALRLLED